MPAPRVAIVGRPNVGKSSLLNMIARERISIVDPTPGVTRDRVSVYVELDGPEPKDPKKPLELIDTGGYGVYVAEGQRFNEVNEDLSRLTGDIERQIAAAVSGADLILFAVDVQAGITAADEEIARLLRTQKLGRAKDSEKVPVRVIATKVDGPKWETHAYELSGLGFGEPLMCSSTTNYLRRTMLEQLYGILPETDGEGEPKVDMKLAIVGKRNAGKSSLVNRLAGAERVIVSEIAGTTRDAIDVRFEMDGRSFLAIDTAGLRRRKSFQDQIEWYAFDRAQRAIERADVCLLLIDATEPISQVDEQMTALVQKSYKPVVIVINKWDLVEGRVGPKGRPVTVNDYEDYVRRELKGLSFAPIAFMSAKEGTNVHGVIDVAFDLHRQASQRVGTGELNRLVKGILEVRGPSNKLGTQAKVYYAAQVRTNPPTLVLIVNRTELFDPMYERFLMNRFREKLPFEEVPIRLILRSKRRAEEAVRDREKRRMRAEGTVGKQRMYATDAEGGFEGDFDIDPEQLDMDVLLSDLPEDARAYFDE